MYSLLLANILNLNFKKYLNSVIFCSQTSISMNVKKESLDVLLYFLKNSNFFHFKSLVDIFGMDLLGRSTNYRFLTYYVLYSRLFGITLTLKVALNTQDILNTAVVHFNSASWLEREVFDMYGIFFYKNNDMRRILSDYGFDGYPLRKDFPLTGFFEVQYSEEEKVVISQSTRVPQALRLFHYSSVWDLAKKNK
jgi:NADH:ubiquinone oxidoreductase subunit C